jgi:hypothetical protein
VDLVDGVILVVTSLVGLVLVARPNGIGRIHGGVLVAAYGLYLVAAVGSQIS